MIQRAFAAALVLTVFSFVAVLYCWFSSVWAAEPLKMQLAQTGGLCLIPLFVFGMTAVGTGLALAWPEDRA